LDRRNSRAAPPLVVGLLVAALALGGGPLPMVRVDDWDGRAFGPLNLAAPWRAYPFSRRPPFLHPPAIVLDDGRRVLQLMTDGEAVRIGRAIKVDVHAMPWLVWEWKPLVLPAGGDVRDHHRSDQAGRVMLVFEGMRALLYVWDTTAPVGTEALPDGFDIFQRALIVVRSGSQGLGQWDRQRRDVRQDYRRIFEDEPRSIKWVGLESHSDLRRQSHSAILFRSLYFEAR
jgi:hypothetical protein